MRIVITDSSCLIDLKKGNLLRAMLDLPFEFAIPQPLMEEELLSLTDDEKAELVTAGLEVVILSADQVDRVVQYHRENRRPSINDYFALVLSEDIDDAILLTADGALREIAEAKDVETHGVLWVLDQLHEHSCAPSATLVAAIQTYINDPDVWLPKDQLRRRARLFKAS